MMHELRIGVCYDFRNPPDSGVSHQRLYEEVLAQVQWLDAIGADLVWFTEHHFVEDAYLPSWVPVAGAMAAVTERVRFGTDICLMPFNHPVRLAEFSLRHGSGGAGAWPGGDGLVRVYEFLSPVTVSLLTERRVEAPFGLAGGEAGRVGVNWVESPGESPRNVGSRASVELAPGDRLRVETPGGGGFGRAVQTPEPGSG